MKIQIRHSVFETNSSSTHAVALLSDEEYKKYQNEEIMISRYGEFITKEEFDKKKEKAKQRAINNIKTAWEDKTNWDYPRLHNNYKTLESAIENLDEDDIYDDAVYEYDTNNMEIEHVEREFNGVKVHALSVYGYDE